MKFSDRWIKALQPKDTEYQLRESHGFTIRVLPSGIKRWEYVYISPSSKKRRRMSLGNYPDVSLADAHQGHTDARALLLKGIDPQNIQPAESITPPSPSISKLKESYIDHIKSTLVPRSVKHQSERLDKHLIPLWGNRLVTDITRQEAIILIKNLAEKTPGAARNVLLAARAMFTYAIDHEEIVSQNPFSRVGKAVPNASPKEGDRFLTEDELKYIVPLLKFNSPDLIRRALLLTLYTGQRAGEVVGLKWSDFEQSGRWWFITKERAKNNIGSLVYLSSPARRLIKPLKGLDPIYIFPASRGATGPIGVTSLDSHVERYLGKERYAGLPRWTPHDLRRTCSTHLQRLRCPDPVIWSIQNHKLPGISAIYNRYQYADEKREWLIRWAWELRCLIRQSCSEGK
jgi:integrase